MTTLKVNGREFKKEDGKWYMLYMCEWHPVTENSWIRGLNDIEEIDNDVKAAAELSGYSASIISHDIKKS